ncbi:hypothetical protein [Bifidobacterium adolescentis]|uniref:hypothetical protein n=1 Tax=Bifidobacterium adolescentis TaxID=1680 RepID=UPI001C2302DF|nr:hypothetical protein [Bifidobacterium adolescentis]MBU9081045.1 hypothetical protein [Bifidobacterium adolescentis]
MVRKAFFSFLPAARFAKQEMKDILQAGCALRNHINAYEKAGILEKGETRIPARRCEVLLHKQTAYGRVVPAFARLSARSGGAYEQSTGLFT